MPTSTPAWVVTGPTSGFGRATALQLSEHGVVILVESRDLLITITS